MTEITVGGITAALWAGEPFGLRELVGVLLISGAALVDSIWDFWQARRCHCWCGREDSNLHGVTH